jgi:predicted transcriptional regulator
LSKEGRYKYFIEVIDWEKIERLNKDYHARMEKTISKQDEVINAALDDYISNSLIEDIKKHMITKSNFKENDW